MDAFNNPNKLLSLTFIPAISAGVFPLGALCGLTKL
jgi:hypothetical protein